jgi:sugar lactone lactonase YvrE
MKIRFPTGTLPHRIPPAWASAIFLAANLGVGDNQAASPTLEPFRIASFTPAGRIDFTGTFTNGVVVVEQATTPEGPWRPRKNIFTTSNTASAPEALALNTSPLFFRGQSLDLGNGRAGFTNLTRAYGLLSTIAGVGGPQDVNNWRPEYEGGPATSAVLSGPHMTQADRAGNYYIADKDAHGIRKIRTDGTIITVAGVNLPGDGVDTPTPGTQVALREPNGLWVRGDGTLFILDLGNGKVRRLDTNGLMQTLFVVPGGITVGRGLWVSDDETLAYVCSLNVIKRWRAGEGVTDFSIGYSQLGNLIVEPSGSVVVADRSLHQVYRLDTNGVRTAIAGNGLTFGGGDGQLASVTAFEEVRAVWQLPNGGFFLGTHRGSQVWYVDPDGYAHLFLNGNRSGAHAGDGTWFYNILQARVSEIRAVTLDYDGNLIITEHDGGFVRRVQFLPFQD